MKTEKPRTVGRLQLQPGSRCKCSPAPSHSAICHGAAEAGLGRGTDQGHPNLLIQQSNLIILSPGSLGLLSLLPEWDLPGCGKAESGPRVRLYICRPAPRTTNGHHGHPTQQCTQGILVKTEQLPVGQSCSAFTPR